MKKFIWVTITVFSLFSCSNKKNYDATGSFEAVETIISAQGMGNLLQLDVEEGENLQAGQTIGFIDSTQLVLRKKQLAAQSNAVVSRKPDINAQVAAYKEQLKQAEHEQQRLVKLVQADAATKKQLDDANAQINIIKKQIAAQESALATTSQSLSQETVPINMQVAQLNDQLSKYRIVNPITGTVLTKYAEVNELVTTGKPLYKIADLSSMILRAYITGSQLSQIRIGQPVKVRIDAGKNNYKQYTGTIEWISSQAEFTPKTIQTKDERQNLVYAIKVRVKNDGYLKIGMYGEIIF